MRDVRALSPRTRRRDRRHLREQRRDIPQIGARVLLVHARHEEARRFYERWGFEQSPTDPLNLQLLFKDG
jgi:hypothetical protein